MEFIVTTSDIKNNHPAQDFLNNLRSTTKDRQGYCYYKYPIAGGISEIVPHIIIADIEYGLSIFYFYSDYSLEDIDEVTEYNWKIKGSYEDSLLLKLEDYVTSLKSHYDKFRPLRNQVKVNYYLVFPNIKRNDFQLKFSEVAYDFSDNVRYKNELIDIEYNLFWKDRSYLETDAQKLLFLSVTQGAGRLNNFKNLIEGATSDKIGQAIKLIDTKISYLDSQQHAAAIQIPDGPQRIRGMAGTGKTVILAMKAAYLHKIEPEKKILYTFNTQSLYNQIRDLITKFYRDTEEQDPNWNNLLIMHAWGGRTTKEGVYSRACMRNSINFIPFSYTNDYTLEKVCDLALQKKIIEEYDYVLMDEAQDFPISYFQLIYRLTSQPKRIIFAYDELQSLNRLAIADTGDLFGYKADGTKVVDFSKGFYEGRIEMDFVLKKSYRNPINILMTAHAIGLGLYNTDGYMQVIDNKDVWKSIGYEITNGDFIPNTEIEIRRPATNSMSLVSEIYTGSRRTLEYLPFESREAEIIWIASQIENDIKGEQIEPHHIIVISLNKKNIENYFRPLQNELFNRGVPSIIPGVGGIDRDKFGEKGFVTLSTVYKAKGNEGFIIYVMAFDYLYDHAEFVLARNIAFTSISRAKGWCRISGVGENMKRAITEIQLVESHIPKFVFQYPDPEKVRRKLSQEENAMHLLERKKGRDALTELLSTDSGALEVTDEIKELLRKKLGL